MSPLLLPTFYSVSFDVPLKGAEKKESCGGGEMRRNIFFMWQMASFYVRVMSTADWGGMVEVVE